MPSWRYRELPVHHMRRVLAVRLAFWGQQSMSADFLGEERLKVCDVERLGEDRHSGISGPLQFIGITRHQCDGLLGAIGL